MTVPERRDLTRRAIVAFGRFHGAAYEATDGRWGRRMRGKDMALLWTTGRRSGQLRRTALLCVPHEGDILVAASFFGSAAHPAWFLNLRDRPHCEVRYGRTRFEAEARVAEGEERERLWEVMSGQWPPYLDYQERTDREIPVVVLTPRSPGG